MHKHMLLFFYLSHLFSVNLLSMRMLQLQMQLMLLLSLFHKTKHMKNIHCNGHPYQFAALYCYQLECIAFVYHNSIRSIVSIQTLNDLANIKIGNLLAHTHIYSVHNVRYSFMQRQKQQSVKGGKLTGKSIDAIYVCAQE